MPKNPMFNVRISVQCESCEKEACIEIITTQMINRRDMIVKLKELGWKRFNNGWVCPSSAKRTLRA